MSSSMSVRVGIGSIVSEIRRKGSGAGSPIRQGAASCTLELMNVTVLLRSAQQNRKEY